MIDRRAAWSAMVAGLLALAAPASAASFSCGMRGAAPAVAASDDALLDCAYAHAPGLHRIDEGGPWLHIDLLHDSLATLQALSQGTSGKTMYTGGPKLPPLGLVHSYICLSDPIVAPGDCPEDYPKNPANQGLGFTLNPSIKPMLQQGLKRLRAAGLKTIIRFTYNYPHGRGDDLKGNDAPIGAILEQMRALAPVINRNRDVIYAMQAGFIGFWGEWHNSSSGNDDVHVHNRFLDQFRALFAGSTLLEVRDPYQIRDYSLHLFREDSGHKREIGLGMHNDAFATPPFDGGTFVPGAVDGGPPYTEAELRRTAQTAGHLFSMEASPGEASTALQNCDTATADNFLTYAATYSLSGYDVASASSPLLQQGGCLNQALARVGPHFTLRAASLRRLPGPEHELLLGLRIENTGWARLSRPRALYLSLAPQGGAPVLHRIDADLSSIAPGETFAWSVAVPVNPAPGHYRAALAAPDPAERLRGRADYALLFESTDVADATAGVNVLGRFEVPPS
jgi:hypothetical protein